MKVAEGVDERSFCHLFCQVTGNMLNIRRSRMSFFEIRSSSITSSFSFSRLLVKSIFAAMGIIGLDDRPFQSPHFIFDDRYEASI